MMKRITPSMIREAYAATKLNPINGSFSTGPRHACPITALAIHLGLPLDLDSVERAETRGWTDVVPEVEAQIKKFVAEKLSQPFAYLQEFMDSVDLRESPLDCWDLYGREDGRAVQAEFHFRNIDDD